MQIDLSGKVALVTGASSGIGAGIAQVLAEAGAKVAVNYNSSREKAEDVVSRIRQAGGIAQAFQGDVTSAEQIAVLVKQIGSEMGTIDILINNAGHMLERLANAEMTESLYSRVIDLNLKSTVFMSKAVLPGMFAQRSGRIVNMSSVAAHHGGGPGASIYAASKAAVIAYTKGLAKEAAPYGVLVNCVSPGFIGSTRFHAQLTSEEGRQAAIAGTPLGRQGEPADVAGAVLFLASSLSGFITGETIEINGGAYMR
ncbi:SDR family NAD(P)-dependent oxidoreductase [Paenibacillus hamazuiensis]|uniref:SDR family NAD(P)-dependent oxidoreductase n=1 Tax=Paenibacillus hamazuiensis TaxID=2936508 RepID=UPI00200E19AC|nr:3-oxoacyl-ACP reductase family protein [Paenibacillus hamazuiensis]